MRDAEYLDAAETPGDAAETPGDAAETPGDAGRRREMERNPFLRQTPPDAADDGSKNVGS
tara:strand:- start:266 stop:445 length:180 start_codon:yes stop_codon:yes gene_type:complete